MKQSKIPHITMISTLPPIEKGMSKYSIGLVKELSKVCKVDFLGFNKIYPKFLYPGKIYSNKEWDYKHSNLKVRNVLNWYNPFGWIIEALRINTEVVHVQHWTFFLSPIYLTILGISKLRGKTNVLTIHNVELHEGGNIKNFLYKSVFRLGDEFIVHTEKNKKQLSNYVSGKIHVMPHGLIEPQLSSLTKSQARSKLQINSKTKVLLCFGNIREYKGLDDALVALASIEDSNIKLMIAGECWENWNKYQSIIDKHGLSSKVFKYTKFIPDEDLEIYFKSSDLILLPYKHFDAQSGVGSLVLPFEKPMIITNTGGLPDLVLNKDMIVEPNSPEELKSAIIKVLRNEQLMNSLIEDSKKLKSNLGWKNIVKKYVGRVY